MEENLGTAKEQRLFVMCMKKFIKKVFQHMVASRFSTWKELDIISQEGMAYPIYNYIINLETYNQFPAGFKNYGFENDGNILLADLSVAAMLEEEDSIGIEFYLYETIAITPFICENFSKIQDEAPHISQFTKVDHDTFEELYVELKQNGIFDQIYYELNKSILLIEFQEKEELSKIRVKTKRLIDSYLDRANNLAILSTITATDHKELYLQFPIDEKIFSIVILKAWDLSGNSVYSAALITPEYKSIAHYDTIDSLYEKVIKALRGKQIENAEEMFLSTFSDK